MILLQTGTAAANAALGDEHRVFAFEADFADDLRCIPMVVRFKLDRCGIKLSLRQWSKFGHENRARLLLRRCDAPREVDAYRETLIRLIASCSGGPAVWLAAEIAPVWADIRGVPLPVIEQAARSAIAPPTAEQWARLLLIQRFALVKLARSDHDNENFLPAMREFGLTT